MFWIGLSLGIFAYLALGITFTAIYECFTDRKLDDPDRFGFICLWFLVAAVLAVALVIMGFSHVTNKIIDKLKDLCKEKKNSFANRIRED